ncbi:hypothetical protein [Rhizobium johnstonii]|uniref:hypothetical protein n=1 Tax=Rhizobium johnstonii TaxID=3019933 RepID=UPI003F9B096A
MTAARAIYFLERFKREEKLLGPNEQLALDFSISALCLIEERDRLREALEFYADELTWADTNPKNDGRITVLVPSPSFAEIDRGERARAALEGDAS